MRISPAASSTRGFTTRPTVRQRPTDMRPSVSPRCRSRSQYAARSTSWGSATPCGRGESPGIRGPHLSVARPTLVNMAFATEHPVLAHSEYRAVDDVVRAGGAVRGGQRVLEPAGDQPAAIDELERRIRAGERDVVLLGATGTGKSATTAWLIERLQRPTLVMAPNKTLAAQLANELREMLPHNAVEYFVSYYDYYQPEAYIAQTDTYIEKDSSINDDVERLRHSATSSLLSRRDVVVVASVSCIYGLGTPQSYLDRSVELKVGDEVPRDGLLRLLVDVQYTRNDMAFTRGSFRVRGDTVEIIPSYEELAVRIEYFGDEIEALYYMHPLTGDVVRKVDSLRVFPGHPLRRGPGADGARDLDHREGARGAPGRTRGPGQAAGGAAAADAHQLRRRDDAPGRLLLGHRELLAAHRRPRRGHRARDAARLLPRRLPDGHRRIARHGAADRRHVRGRHVAQAQPGRLRFPAAVGRRQPAADLGGVRRPDRPDGVSVGDARAVRAQPGRRRVRRAGHPADRAGRSAGRSSNRPRVRSTT